MKKDGLMATPIKLTIYDPETHESKKELQTSLVPWGILKRAIKLARTLKYAPGQDSLDELLESLDEEGFDNLTGLVADVFHGQVTIEELNWGTETTEMLVVLSAVITRAFAEFPGSKGQPADPTKRG